MRQILELIPMNVFIIVVCVIAGTNLLTWLITWLGSAVVTQRNVLKHLPEESKYQIEKRDKKIKVLEAKLKDEKSINETLSVFVKGVEGVREMYMQSSILKN